MLNLSSGECTLLEYLIESAKSGDVKDLLQKISDLCITDEAKTDLETTSEPTEKEVYKWFINHKNNIKVFEQSQIHKTKKSRKPNFPSDVSVNKE